MVMKCLCSGSCWLCGLCIMQLITVGIRLTFDALGFQWSCIIADFCHLTTLILCFYGACREKRGFIAVYCLWNLVWIGWNILIICAYLGVLPMEYYQIIFNLDLSESLSWFKGVAYDCSPTSGEAFDEKLCILDYRNIEIFQSGLQTLLSIAGFCVGCYQVGKMKEDTKFHSDYVKDSTKPEEIPLQIIPSRV